MSNSYIPSKDGDLEAWLLNFKTLIAASPTSYGLVTSDGTAVTNTYNAWHTAYSAAVNPTTRTKITVAAKNTQKALTLAVVRGYAATIRANAAVSDSLKGGLGLHVRDTVPTPVPPPATYPMLNIRGMMQGVQDLQAADSAAPSKRGKPTGTAGLLLFRAIGTTAATQPEQAAFLSFVTRTEYKVSFDPADNGKTATYFARWTNSKGEVGPWGPAASMPIAA